MRSLTAEELLLAAERLRHEPLPRRAAGLVALGSNTTLDEAMELPLGERDGRLLALRAATFGRSLTAVSSCPQCGERCEIELDANAFPGETRDEVETAGVRVRVPNGHDVLAAIASDDPRRTIIERCVVEGTPDDDALTAIETALERADPRADIRLALACPACGAAWENALDITTFFWSEIRVAAGRLASEVHILASAYGWPEHDILAMTPWRRQLYVDLVSA
jgi:hypothetical protein